MSIIKIRKLILFNWIHTPNPYRRDTYDIDQCRIYISSSLMFENDNIPNFIIKKLLI